METLSIIAVLVFLCVGGWYFYIFVPRQIARNLSEVPEFDANRIFVYRNCGVAFDRARLQIAFAFDEKPAFRAHISAIRGAEVFEWTDANSPNVKRYRMLFKIADETRPEVTVAFRDRQEAMQALEIVNQLTEVMHVQVQHERQLRAMKILFLAANPNSQSRLDLEREARDLERELRGVRFRDQITMISRHGISPDDLVRHVEEDQPNVVHFSGHGSQSGIVLRADDSDGFHVINGDDLTRFFEDRGVELVVLNACYSEIQARAIQASVPAIIGTRSTVGDEAARRFTVAFYRSLGNGLTIGRAFRSGTDAVRLYGLRDVFHNEGHLDLTLVP